MISETNIKQLRGLLEGEKQIVIVSHTNPDGDAIGSSLAWARVLRKKGHAVSCVVPNKYPYFLGWMEGIEELIIYKENAERVAQVVDKADIIFCLDFNSLSRLEGLSEVIGANTSAKRVLIDHHLEPDAGYDVSFSHPDASSTCFVVYSVIEAMWGTELLDKSIGELLYVGMMTDTGNFSFSFLTPALYRSLAVLAEKGIEIQKINSQVYNSFSEDRARLFGYVINRKMSIIRGGTVAYMALTEQEMRRYNFQQGDSEGFVNYPLSIQKMKISVIFIEHRKFIRISFRSRPHIDVNLFARKYFDGGGHKNAAGGKSYRSMEQTIAHFLTSIKEFAEDGGLD
ncbi:MAG: bifunctional oligoribonuclease/PAP phosphatase NrnA [Rikenellaceae bacterium]